SASILCSRRMYHYKIAAYTSTRGYARQHNRLDEARLLQKTLSEEARTDHGLSDLAEAQIKADAQSEADLYAPPLVAASSEPEIVSRGTATACAVTGDLEVSAVKLSPVIPR